MKNSESQVPIPNQSQTPMLKSCFILELGSGDLGFLPTLGFVPQRVINEHEGRHRFNNWHRPWQHAWVMPAAGLQCGIFELDIDGLLFLHDRSNRLEGDSKVNRLPVGNPTLNSARTVGG